ncbi:TadE/TadG family type IV pilus assembly protein [Actinospongicola halichondriae]|uniref:TadE/TadG family type IV pilus assembly protein n=1 Tax=Actinospongicola halichondriae TaxID=3236844 RepID=UPI003D56DEBE
MRPHRRARDSRGVALLEAALVLPLLLFLAIGMIESGFAWRDANGLARATQSAARIDARVADARSADYDALRSLQSGLSSISASSIVKVIIYDASTTANRPPQDCLDQNRPDDTTVRGVMGLCNVYSATQVSTDDPTKFATINCAGQSWDRNWCPSDRDRDGDDADRVGVWVELRYDKVTKVLPVDLALTHGAVFQLEPCIAGDPSC